MKTNGVILTGDGPFAKGEKETVDSEIGDWRVLLNKPAIET